jgi:hypothetical protein
MKFLKDAEGKNWLRWSPQSKNFRISFLDPRHKKRRFDITAKAQLLNADGQKKKSKIVPVLC